MNPKITSGSRSLIGNEIFDNGRLVHNVLLYNAAKLLRVQRTVTKLLAVLVDQRKHRLPVAQSRATGLTQRHVLDRRNLELADQPGEYLARARGDAARAHVHRHLHFLHPVAHIDLGLGLFFEREQVLGALNLGGHFWYSPFSINDLTVIAEYTKIRPYVYTHTNEKNSYSTFGESIGHWIGPNSDEFLFKAAYNLNERIRLNCSYQYIRSGENIYDSENRLVFNAGGDLFVPYRMEVDPEHINFLDGDFESSIHYSEEDWKEPARKDKLMYDFGITSMINDKARVFKGGSWKDRAYWMVPGTRRFLDEAQETDYIGFRCAMARVGSPQQ